MESTIDANGWTAARSILPFSSPSSIASLHVQSQLRPITVAITGTHCAGKSTIGRKVASVMSWEFHNELGDTLREKKTEDGHRDGYSTGWYEIIRMNEIQRDQEAKFSRIVETW